MEMYAPAMFYHSIFSDAETTEIKNETEENPLVEMKLETGPNIKFPDPEESVECKKRKQQECYVCGKILSSASSFYVHMKQHSENKPYLCSMCNASFSRKPYLEVHMRTHTGEKPYGCDICHKRFTQKSSLNTHRRNHTGLKPFACQICSKTFSVKSYLVAHEFSHATAIGISCNICNTRFHNRSEYAAHMETHKTREFECKSCHKFFTKESYLIRHKIRVHTETNSDGV